MSEQQPESFAEFARAVQAFADSMAKTVTDWFEQHRPLIEALATVADLPEVQAEIRRREALRAVRRGRLPAGCYCLCTVAHPDDKGICDGEPVTVLVKRSEAFGAVRVPVCAPCGAAQMAAELSR